jgi:hypothetical protein
MGIIKKYHDKKWTLQLLAALYNNIDIDISMVQASLLYYTADTSYLRFSFEKLI